MVAVCEEFYTSPTLSSSPGDASRDTIERTFKILNTEDESDAIDSLIAAAPSSETLNGVLLSRVTFDVDHTDYGVWTGTAKYSKRSAKAATLESGQSSYQFETGGGTTHITHSRQTVQKRMQPGGGTAPEFYQAIGFNGRDIAGCDIVTPTYTFSETHVLPAANVQGAYKLALFKATGKVNAAGFKGLAAGEVLFLGASGSSRGSDEWEISYRFAASENVSGLSIGGITGINKKGWEYLWLYFQDEVSEQVLVKKPLCSIVEQVYLPHDFSLIGIGT